MHEPYPVYIQLRPTGQKMLTDVVDEYLWGSIVCFQLADGSILKVPEGGIRTWLTQHRPHPGTTKPNVELDGKE